MTIDLTCISYFEIQKFVDKTQTKFPEFKLEIFSKKVSSIYVEKLEIWLDYIQLVTFL